MLRPTFISRVIRCRAAGWRSNSFGTVDIGLRAISGDPSVESRDSQPMHLPCLRSYIVSSSDGPKNVIAIPCLPARPVRPIRWIYFSIVDDICQLMTHVTSGTSIPRPACPGGQQTLRSMERHYSPNPSRPEPRHRHPATTAAQPLAAPGSCPNVMLLRASLRPVRTAPPDRPSSSR